MKSLLITAMTLCLLYPSASAQSSAQNPAPAAGGPSKASVPVRMVVTAEPLQGSEAPPIGLGGVTAWQGSARAPITEWLPGDKAGLELYVLIDERVDPSQVALFEQLRRFVSQQSPSTAVGIAYMLNGEARIAQTPTKDHGRAVQALRVSSGNESAGASPFTSLSALVNGWTDEKEVRHEVLAVTDGIDRFGDFGDLNMYVGQTVADAQRAGVTVYGLYAPSLGHASHSPALIRWGQAYLGQLAEETGGEAYLDGSVDLFLADLNRHLAHQYMVTFLAAPGLGAGFRSVRFTTEIPNVDLIAAYGYYAKAAAPQP